MTAEHLSEITDYIIRFLLGSDSNETFSRLIGYTSDKEQFSKYKIVIIPSGFFNPEFYNTEKSLPQLPLTVWEGIPLLFGEPVSEKSDETFQPLLGILNLIFKFTWLMIVNFKY